MRVSITGDVPDSPELTKLERGVLETALSADAQSNIAHQAQEAQVASRTYSGVGFITKLSVPDDAPRLQTAVLPTVYGRHPNLAASAEFMLQLKDGRLHSIEAFCFQGMWPSDEDGFTLGTAP